MFACASTADENTIWLRTPPEDWVSLLKSCHADFRKGDGSNRDAMHVLAHLLYNVRQAHLSEDPIEHPWETLFDHDIIPALVDLLCDFDFDVDIERHGLNVARDHLSDLLALLASSLEYLYDMLPHRGHRRPELNGADCSQCIAASTAITSMVFHGSTVFENIWNHRTPLLDTDIEDMFRDHCCMHPEWHGLHGTVCAIACQMVCYVNENKQFYIIFGPSMVEVAKLCLFVWLYAVRTLQRERALDYIHSGLTHKDGSMMYHTWYRGVIDGDVEHSQIFRAFLRDVRDRDVVGEGLARRLVLLMSFRPKLAYVSLYDPMELSMFWSGLAAYRRHLCSGHLDPYQVDRPPGEFTELIPQKRIFDFVTMALAGSLIEHSRQRDLNAPTTPWIHIHAAILVLAEAVLNRLNDECYELYGGSYYIHLNSATKYSAWVLNRHCARQSVDASTRFARPSQRMRRLSLEHWQKANDWLIAQKCIANTRWRPICHAWKLLGEALQRGEDVLRSSDVHPDDLEPAKRCAWDECFCSAYKATHDLRLCKGCWAVAYCNSKCQTSDWENHRRTCAQGRSEELHG